MQYRIGDRDPVTGLYDVIYPDGSHTRNGIKIFNSQHEFGDVVLATRRSDGMMILDSVKATLTEVAPNSFGLGGFGEKPVGYLAGQVFNNEAEVILPTVSIEFAPGSPEELEPNAGVFVVRIKIDRPQTRDLQVKCELSGTAVSADYSYIGLDSGLMATISAGELFFDITITPTANSLGQDETIIADVLQDSAYKISQNNSATATILAITLLVSIEFAPGSPTELEPGAGDFVVRIKVDPPQSNNLQVICELTGTSTPGQYTTIGIVNSIVTISSGSLYTDITISPISNTSGVDITVVATLLLSSDYTIGIPSAVTATIKEEVQVPSITADIQDYPNNDPVATVTIPPSRTRVQDGQGDGFRLFVRSNIVNSVAKTVNIAISGITLSDYIILENVNNYTGTSIVIPAGQLFATVALTHKDRPRMIPPSETLVMQVVPGNGYTVGVVYQVEGITTRRLRRVFDTFTNSITAPMPVCPQIAPLEFFVSSSLRKVRNRYTHGYYSGSTLVGIGGGFWAVLNFDTGALISYLFTTSGDPAGETLPQRRARYLAAAIAVNSAAVEIITPVLWERTCNYTELGDP
jgi:hypothetical protein